MVRRVFAGLSLLLMLNVLALGAGVFKLGGSACTHPGRENRDVPAQTGCNLPWAPGCTSVAPCGPSATIARTDDGLWNRLRSDVISPQTLPVPESPILAPELPPPRI